MKIVKAKTRKDGKVSVHLLFNNGVLLRKVVSAEEAQRWIETAARDARGES